MKKTRIETSKELSQLREFIITRINLLELSRAPWVNPLHLSSNSSIKFIRERLIKELTYSISFIDISSLISVHVGSDIKVYYINSIKIYAISYTISLVRSNVVRQQIKDTLFFHHIINFKNN